MKAERKLVCVEALNFLCCCSAARIKSNQVDEDSPAIILGVILKRSSATWKSHLQPGLMSFPTFIKLFAKLEGRYKDSIAND